MSETYSPMVSAVYPRWRGEHLNIWVSARAAYGLSPLARGTRHVQQPVHLWLRFIPAGAGNTLSRPNAHADFPVYPRWRGEHLPEVEQDRFIDGLSPLARGTHIQGVGRGMAERFIPAGAGNTSVACTCASSLPVYPRWRGEHQVKDARVSLMYGLSPLARGTLLASADQPVTGRFIPAGAGNTVKHQHQ